MKPGCVLILLCVAAGLYTSRAQAQQACDTRLNPLSSPTSRFENHGDGTVSDKESRLMWMRCSAGQAVSGGTCSGAAVNVDLLSARSLAADVNRRGQFFYNDWRVPQLKELATIAERQCENPRVNLAIFPNTPAGLYWTASSRSAKDSNSHAFALGFDTEGVVYRPVEEALHVRLVRDEGARP